MDENKTQLFFKLDNAIRELRNAQHLIGDKNRDDVRAQSLIRDALAHVERIQVALCNSADIKYERLLQLRGYVTYVIEKDYSFTIIAQRNGFSYAYNCPIREDISKELAVQKCYEELYRNLEDKAHLGY